MVIQIGDWYAKVKPRINYLGYPSVPSIYQQACISKSSTRWQRGESRLLNLVVAAGMGWAYCPGTLPPPPAPPPPIVNSS